MYTCIVTTQQGSHVSESLQNGIQFANRSSHMAKLQSGRHYVKALSWSIPSDNQIHYVRTSHNLLRYTYSFPKDWKVCSVVSQSCLHLSSLTLTQYLLGPWLGQALFNLGPLEQQSLAQLPASQEHQVEENNACCCHSNEPLQYALVS